MEARWATDFDEYVDWMALNSPRATVTDWWRRLDYALDDYAKNATCQKSKNKYYADLEAEMAKDPNLGTEAAGLLRRMRHFRNRVEHERDVSVSREQASRYAWQALSFIGAITAQRPLKDYKLFFE